MLTYIHKKLIKQVLYIIQKTVIGQLIYLVHCPVSTSPLVIKWKTVFGTNFLKGKDNVHFLS